MTSEPPTLLDRVAAHLDRAGVPFALIGAAALAVHGISRATLDLDLLATDRRVLEGNFWTLGPDVDVDIRTGDAADPLAGVVRCRTARERDVDIVVGKVAWQADVVARAEHVQRSGHDIPAARVDDLVLLKLYAGGSQDRWDIEQLLHRPDRAHTTKMVEARLASLPKSAQEMWRKILAMD
jgi:hypothetical protein